MNNADAEFLRLLEDGFVTVDDDDCLRRTAATQELGDRLRTGRAIAADDRVIREPALHAGHAPALP